MFATLAGAVQFFLSILPLIGPAVDAAEALFPNRGVATGAQKLAHVVGVVQAGVSTLRGAAAEVPGVKAAIEAGDVEAMTAGITHLVNYTVKLRNQIEDAVAAANAAPGGQG